MSFFLSPVFNDQAIDVNGDPLTGGQIETYLAGSSSPAATYTSSTGAVQQSNPIILNSLGYPSSPIWLNSGTTYKFVIKSASGVTLRTIDGVRGINDASVSVSEWVESGFVPTYISATSFSVPGDQTGTLQVGRRLKTTNTAGTVYSGITVSAFGSGVTTVTVLNDSGTLDAGLSAIAYGLISADNTSFPFATFAAANTVAVVDDGATATTIYPLFASGTAGQQAPKTDITKLKYKPSTGELSATLFKGSAASLTAIPAAQITGDIPAVNMAANIDSLVDPRVAALEAAKHVGAIGTYAFCRVASGLANPGDMFTGASLSYTDGFSESIFTPIGGSSVWECMGRIYVTDRGTLFKRIS